MSAERICAKLTLGPGPGTTREEVERENPQAWTRWRIEGIEGWEDGETYAEAMVRVGGAISELAADSSGPDRCRGHPRWLHPTGDLPPARNARR